MRHGENHGARITTYKTPLRNTDPGYARDQRYPAIQNPARRCSSCRVQAGTKPGISPAFFALLNLGFEYWEPTGGAISSNERKLITGYAKFPASYGGNEGALLDAAEHYLEQVASRRVTNGISLCKSFDAYRAQVTIQAGHYDAIKLPDGTLQKHPRSISFANMDEIEFQQLYKAALDVLWRWILSKAFRDRGEAENAAAQLMSFAG